MGVDINWSLGAPMLNSNPGEQFTNAFTQGATGAAMGALGRDPGNQNAMNALMQFNPQAGMAMQDRQASRAAAQSQAQLRQAQTVEQQLENRRNDIIMGASFLEGVTDDAGYQAAVQRARSAGVNIEGAPPTFDQNYVGGVRQTAQALLAAQQRRSPQAGAPYRWRDNGGNLMEMGEDGQPRQAYRDPIPRMQWVRDPATGREGWVTQPQVGPSAGPQGQQGAQPPVVEALPPGFVYEDEGGAGQGAPGTFPDNEFIDPNVAGGWR